MKRCVARRGGGTPSCRLYLPEQRERTVTQRSREGTSARIFRGYLLAPEPYVRGSNPLSRATRVKRSRSISSQRKSVAGPVHLGRGPTRRSRRGESSRGGAGFRRLICGPAQTQRAQAQPPLQTSDRRHTKRFSTLQGCRWPSPCECQTSSFVPSAMRPLSLVFP
jgi:hypothetical protein